MSLPASSPTARPPFKPLKPLDEALSELLGFVRPFPQFSQFTQTETVSTFDADGRVLAQDLLSSLSVPAHDNSSMDGYALRCADWQSAETAFPVTQRIPAGSSGHALEAGSAARIFTGSPIPAGADAVVMQEDCDVEGNQIRVRVAPRAGQWIRRRGEDVAVGTQVLAQGTRLTPAALGMAASIGFAQLNVAPRVRVVLFSTGDELVMPGDVAPQNMKPGAIYNSNRFFLKALLLRLGCVVTDLGIVPDKLDATIAALKGASEHHDLIVTSGGVSVGEEDHIKPAVEALGKLDLWQIAMKPGKPFAHGKIGHSHFLGLPGNPVSSFVTFMVLVRPFILKMQGALEVAPKSIALPAHFDWPKADKRREFLRVRQNAEGGLDLFSNQSSGVLTSAVWGDGLVDNPAGQTIAKGDTVRFLPFSGLMA